MQNAKYKLTISLLASNRKDTLPKTLASLKPILDNVSSELIVVDTGCDEDLLEIIRQYTDKIYKFEWCKDFAKARNVGIDHAEGDWFMFIDDDEWFEDVTEFIEFFNSDEMKKYNYGKYVVRNYENIEGTAWTDSIAGRMFRMFEGTKFKDAIHERPVNIAGPTKDFVSYAHHYGYVYKSEEERRAHIKRNLELLLEQIKREPGCARHYCHLTQEYNVLKEYEKSLEYALEGIANADMTVSENTKDIAGLYGTVVWVMLNQLRYEEAIKVSKEYLESPYMSDLGQLSLYGFMTTAAYKLGRYEVALAYAKCFFEKKQLFVENPDLAYKQDAILIMLSLSQENIERIASVAFVAAVNKGSLEDMIRYAAVLSSGPKALVDPEDCMVKLAGYMAKESEHMECAKILKWVMINKSYFAMMLNCIECMKDEDMSGFLNIADIMANIESNHGYIQFMTIISKRNEDKSVLEPLYEKAIRDINDIINLHHHFWAIAAQRQIPIAQMIDQKPMDVWVKKVDEWAVNAKVKEVIEKKQDLSANMYSDGMHMKYFDVVLVEHLMYRKKLENISFEDIRMELIKYTNAVMDFYRTIYRDEVFNQCPTMLPTRCQVALILVKVLCGSSGDVANDMKKVATMMPLAKSIVEKYLELAKG